MISDKLNNKNKSKRMHVQIDFKFKISESSSILLGCNLVESGENRLSRLKRI